MANPSDVGPSGAGTEVLRRFWRDGQSTGTGQLIVGASDHIYTVLSISFCNKASAAELISMWVDYDASGTDITLLQEHDLIPYSTFIYSEKIVIAGADILECTTTSSADIDIWGSYIDQHF
tara:strand:+ start:394 stop:756 length:363 start_codon:yes stop_codon:yes gene_type:complete